MDIMENVDASPRFHILENSVNITIIGDGLIQLLWLLMLLLLLLLVLVLC